MATLLRARKAAVLFKNESVEGTPETLVGTSDAVKVSNLQINTDPQQIQDDENTGYLDGTGPIPVGLRVSVSFDVKIKGSGIAGVAPEYSALMKACGWTEVATASAVPVAAEAAAAGSSTTLTLGASAAATAQVYRGMPLALTVNPTSGLSFITDYSPDGANKIATLTDLFGTALDNSTEYQILPNVVYSPISDGIPAGTMEVFLDGVKYLFSGSRGNPVFNVATQNVGRMSFVIQGQFISKTDASVPTTAYDATRAPAFRGAVMSIDRSPVALATLSIDCGNEVSFIEDPNAELGYGPAQIVARNMSGSIDPFETLVATRNTIQDLNDGQSRIIHARWGSVAGNRCALTCPAGVYTGLSTTTRNGLAVEQIQFFPYGLDAGAFLCLY